MEYFLMTQDTRIANLVQTAPSKELRSIADRSETEIIQLLVKENEHCEYVDYLENPVPLVSERLKQIMEQIDQKVVFDPVVLADPQHGVQHLYWRFSPLKVQCPVSQAEFNQDGTFKKLHINPEAVAGLRLFQIDQVTKCFIVMNLIVVEMMLRRDLTGFKLTKVVLER
jgi:hypothetical protein